jgi:6-phosphogluconolactonase
MYVLGELDSTVTRFVVTKEGVFNHGLAKYTMLPSGFRGRNDAAEIEIHPNGRFLYASNRGHDSIAVYAIDQDYWGRLTEIGDFPTGGKDPRHFAIDPTGRFLLAENQHSNSIVVFSIDAATGALKEVSRTEGVASPVCLVFLPKP